MKFFLRMAVALLPVVGVDSLSKLWAESALDLNLPVPIVGQLFRLTLNYNTGVAFGLFANGGPWPTILTGGFSLGLVVWLANLLRSGEFPAPAVWPIGLLIGGAFANLVDRLPDGRVTDFLDIGLGAARWPTFNLADSFIVLGVTILILMPLWEQRQLEAKA